MYTYGELLDDVNYLSRYGVETGAIGSSAYGRIIPYVKIGAGKHSVMVRSRRRRSAGSWSSGFTRCFASTSRGRSPPRDFFR